jgi:hypothetical protein
VPTRNYVTLPINPDEGFPQAFRLAFLGATYQLLLYVNVSEETLIAHADTLLDLSSPLTLPRRADELVPHASPPTPLLVLRVAREMPTGPVVLLQQRVVPQLDIPAGELVFLFDRIQIDRRNLNGVGAFGSLVNGKVAARWA